MKTQYRFLSIALACIVAVPVVISLSLPSRQLATGGHERVALDTDAAAERLGKAIGFRTISRDDPADVERNEFVRFHRFLASTYPNVHEALSRERVGGMSLLFTWPGADAEAAPVVLLAHMDVVPAGDSTGSRWTVPPFEGRIEEGFVWGRGALDMKQSLMAQLEAVEYLVGNGFRPRRTVHLGFGHDEEVGGVDGAAQIARRLAERGVSGATTLDEGSAIVHSVLPGLDAPVALVGVAEKGYLTIELTAASEGGHSSSPRYPTAIGRLSQALHRIETNPFPARIVEPVSGMLDYLAPEMPPAMRTVVANRWLFSGLLVSRLSRTPATNALVRTTSAPTMIPAIGEKENVLPKSASAIVNLRILPGDSVRNTLARIRDIVDDDQVHVAAVGEAVEPSRVSSTHAAEFTLLHRTISQVFPDVVVAPSLVIGGTDSKHYAGIARNSYRFVPMRLAAADIARIHGHDERIAVENYGEIIAFYIQFLRNLAQ